MKISIIVPVYGVEKYIERCAKSLFEQTYSNIEYIFVDDCTKDKSIELLMAVLSEYPHRKEQVKLIQHEFNRGLSAARNTGMLHTTAEYIMHIDSDDFVDVTLVEKCVEKVKSTDADIVYVGRKLVYSNLIKESYLPICDDISKWKYNLLSGKFPHTVWGSLIKKSIYIDNNISAIEGLHQGEDFAVMCRLAYYVKSIAVINEPLYNYLIRTNIYKYNRKTLSDTFLSWKVVNDFYIHKEDSQKVKDILWKRMLSFYIWQIRCWVETTDIQKSEAEFIKSIFPGIANYSGIGILKRIILLLFKHNCFYSLKLYIAAVGIMQKITKRRGSEI